MTSRRQESVFSRSILKAFQGLFFCFFLESSHAFRVRPALLAGLQAVLRHSDWCTSALFISQLPPLSPYNTRFTMNHSWASSLQGRQANDRAVMWIITVQQVHNSALFCLLVGQIGGSISGWMKRGPLLSCLAVSWRRWGGSRNSLDRPLTDGSRIRCSLHVAGYRQCSYCFSSAEGDGGSINYVNPMGFASAESFACCVSLSESEKVEIQTQSECIFRLIDKKTPENTLDWKKLYIDKPWERTSVSLMVLSASFENWKLKFSHLSDWSLTR